LFSLSYRPVGKPVSHHVITRSTFSCLLFFGSSYRPSCPPRCSYTTLRVHLRCPLNFFIVIWIYWKSASYRSSLDLSTFGKTTNRSAAKLNSFFFFFGPTCMLFDPSIALRLCHDLFKVVTPTPCSGVFETWVPLGPHRPGSRPSPTSGSSLQKTRRPVSGPDRPSWRPTRPPEGLPKDSPYDLVQHDLKT
jgi:hypothetical protein